MDEEFAAYAPVIMDALAEASAHEANGIEVVSYLIESLEEAGFQIVRK